MSMKTLVDVPEPDIRELDDLGRRRGESRAKIIRTAIGEYLSRNRAVSLDQAMGLWGDGGEDGVDYQQRLRAEW